MDLHELGQLPGRPLGGVMTADEFMPPRRPQRLSEADIERLAGLDPADAMDRGRIMAILGRSDDPSDPARPFTDALNAGSRPGPTCGIRLRQPGEIHGRPERSELARSPLSTWPGSRACPRTRPASIPTT